MACSASLPGEKWRGLACQSVGNIICSLRHACCAGAAQLPKPVDFVVKGHKIPSGAYSLYVREVGQQDPILSVNATSPYNPASVIKIIPTLAALELLGPAYRWKTEVYTLGNIRDGVLQGDILFKGYGDPHLVIEEFRKILEELRRRGIREITGDLLIDDSWFRVPDEMPGAFDNKPYRTYNVQPNAFLVNFKAVHFHFYPSANGRNVRVFPEPELAGLKIDNRLRPRKRLMRRLQRVSVLYRTAKRRPLIFREIPHRLQPLHLPVATPMKPSRPARSSPSGGTGRSICGGSQDRRRTGDGQALPVPIAHCPTSINFKQIQNVMTRHCCSLASEPGKNPVRRARLGYRRLSSRTGLDTRTLK